MPPVKKKRVRILSPGSDSDDVYQGNPKTHENGKNGGKMRNLGDNKADDTENVLKSNTCFVCDGKDDWVLVCHGEECPLAIHQSCASDEPDFDEFGNFYCPYCWYKRVVAKSMKLQSKLMVTEKFRKGRETLGRVDLGLTMDKVTEDVENVEEVNVSGGRRITSVNPSGNRREGDESYEKFMVMETNQRMKEVADESHSGEVSKTDDADVDEGREQRGRFSYKNHETSDAGGERKGRERFGEKNHEKVQVRKSDVGEERKQQGRYDINHDTAQVHSFDAGVKTTKQRIYSERSQRVKRVARTHKRGVFINDEGTQACDSDMGEGRSGQGCCHENDQQKKALSTESHVQEVLRTDKRVSHGSDLGEGRYQQGRHIEKNQQNETVETETREEVSKDGERKWDGAVERDGDEFCLVENQDRQCQADMRNDDATFSEQENDFRKDEQVEQTSVSSSFSSPMSTDNVNDCNAASQELALIIHPTAGLQERPIEARPIETRPYCSVSSKKQSFQPEKYGHKSYLEKNGAASNDPGQRKFILCSDKKRKRLFWTQAEEEMLRVGVQKFPGLRNIPWRKILEYGRDVFHEKRLPSDLKDKWKKMNKMSLDTGKWVSLTN